MTGADADQGYGLPAGVEFLRWSGGGDWVIYHAGTGETLRVSDLALAILDHLADRVLDREALLSALAAQFDDPPEATELAAGLDDHLRLLLAHECIEVRPCASAS